MILENLRVLLHVGREAGSSELRYGDVGKTPSFHMVFQVKFYFSLKVTLFLLVLPKFLCHITVYLQHLGISSYHLVKVSKS